MSDAASPSRSSKRPDAISHQIREWIAERGLRPGDRLPGESELIELFKASKSTVREAMQNLQTQGLIITRTGPGGGAFVHAPEQTRTMELLSNHFFFHPPTIHDIYELRKVLEPQLAASLAGLLSEEDFQRLQQTIRRYDHPALTLGEEYEQRLAELEFHSVLAELCPNPLLGFLCTFLQNLLKELAICRRIYDRPNPELRETGLHYQLRLIHALRNGDAEAAEILMAEHMQAAQTYMESSEVELSAGFLQLAKIDKSPRSR